MKDSKTNSKSSFFQELNRKAIKKANEAKTGEPLIRIPENRPTSKPAATSK